MNGNEPVQGDREALADVLLPVIRDAIWIGQHGPPRAESARNLTGRAIEVVLASAPWQDHAGGVRALREAADQLDRDGMKRLGAHTVKQWLRARADRIERGGDHAGTSESRCICHGPDRPHPPHQSCDSGCQPDWHQDGCGIYLPALGTVTSQDHAGTTVTDWGVQPWDQPGPWTFHGYGVAYTEETARKAERQGEGVAVSRRRFITPSPTPWVPVQQDGASDD